MKFPITDFFDLTDQKHAVLFDNIEEVWDVLKKLKEYIAANLKPEILGTVMEGAIVADDVFIGKGTVVEPGVYIKGPTIIGENCEIRHGAYIRGNCLIGDNCIVGHTSEMKTALLLNGAKVPHFAYVGDSLLGSKSNLGAGTKISNFKITQDEVNVMGNGINMGSGLRKFGAIIGDNVQTGCNTVLNPGTLIGRDSLIYPLTSLRGVIPPRTVVKLQQKSQNRPMR